MDRTLVFNDFNIKKQGRHTLKHEKNSIFTKLSK